MCGTVSIESSFMMESGMVGKPTPVHTTWTRLLWAKRELSTACYRKKTTIEDLTRLKAQVKEAERQYTNAVAEEEREKG